jgi:carboxypeptidase family protein
MMLALLFLWFMATAQQPSPPAASDLGVIKGTVVDLDGKPVEGASVYVGGVRANVEGHNDPPLNSRENETTTNANGDFVLDQVRPGKNVAIHAYTDTDYYMFVTWAFNRPSKLEMPEVEVKPGQTVTGVIVRPIQRAGQLHLYVRDAKTKGLVHGIFFRLCREDHPTEGGYCIGGSGPSDYAQPVPVGVGISIEVSADTHGQSNYQWQYRDPKTGSRYFRAKSGETETMNIYLRQKK